MGELRSRDRGPASLQALHFGESFLKNNLEPELGNAIPVLWARLATRTSCPAPACKALSSALPEFHRRPRLRTWHLARETWQLWTAPTSVGKLGTLTVYGAQDQLRTDPRTRIKAGPEPAPRRIGTVMGPDRTRGPGLIWDPDSAIDNLTRQIRDNI
uniref:Uncharacterized protein n=1 Tax=Pipistrellus kuhlii TaxID=59472 RepID=A0A7J7ZJK3_PIPKU|nr:hypothetical protein mPipKuh1_009451 [Pipistrellus kuhlii]